MGLAISGQPNFHDARYPGKETIHYPLHPLFGQQAPVYRKYGIGNAQLIELQFESRRVAVPVWMIDEIYCGRLTIGLEPRCSLTSLMQLLRLLEISEL